MLWVGKMLQEKGWLPVTSRPHALVMRKDQTKINRNWICYACFRLFLMVHCLIFYFQYKWIELSHKKAGGPGGNNTCVHSIMSFLTPPTSHSSLDQKFRLDWMEWYPTLFKGQHNSGENTLAISVDQLNEKNRMMRFVNNGEPTDWSSTECWTDKANRQSALVQ